MKLNPIGLYLSLQQTSETQTLAFHSNFNLPLDLVRLIRARLRILVGFLLVGLTLSGKSSVAIRVSLL